MRVILKYSALLLYFDPCNASAKKSKTTLVTRYHNVYECRAKQKKLVLQVEFRSEWQKNKSRIIELL